MMKSSPHVINVTDATFQTEVIEYSKQRPVIVDFWAQWCGPCKTLGPALEKLANDYRGAFRLAKVDVDRNQELAMAARVQSIPMVIAVWNGGIVDRFVGALTPAELKIFVDGVVQAAGGLMPGADEEAAPADPARAEIFWRKKLEKDENDSRSLLGLGQVLIQLGRADEARTCLERIKTQQPEYDAAQTAMGLLDLLTEVASAGGEASFRARLASNPSDQRAAFYVACADAGKGRFSAALTSLVDLVANAPADVREDAKKAASKVFMAAGRDDEQVEDLRRQLARLLY